MQYSALRQLRPMFRLAPRRPFPPVENPWAYVRASQADVEFSMTKCVRTCVLGVGLRGRSALHGMDWPTDRDDTTQNHRSLVAVVFVGAFLGYLLANAVNSFFLPTWLLALGGGGIGGYTGAWVDGLIGLVRRAP